MTDGIQAVSSAPNALSNRVNSSTEGPQKSNAAREEEQKRRVEASPTPQEEDPNVRTEEASNVDSAKEVEDSKEVSNVQAEEEDRTDHRGREGNAEPSTAHGESLGTILDVLG